MILCYLALSIQNERSATCIEKKIRCKIYVEARMKIAL